MADKVLGSGMRKSSKAVLEIPLNNMRILRSILGITGLECLVFREKQV